MKALVVLIAVMMAAPVAAQEAKDYEKPNRNENHIHQRGDGFAPWLRSNPRDKQLSRAHRFDCRGPRKGTEGTDRRGNSIRTSTEYLGQ